jgi:hypothetical protein
MTKTMYKAMQAGKERSPKNEKSKSKSKSKSGAKMKNLIKVKDHEQAKKDDQLQMFQDFGNSKPTAKELRDAQVK